MGLFGAIFGVGGAVAGGILGGNAAREQNRSIERNAKASQLAINENINRARFSFADNQRILSQRHQSGVGNASAHIFAGGRSGHSLNRLLASADSDFYADDLARRRGLAHTIENFETQKKNIVRQANASTVNTALAGLGGAIQGFQFGSSVGGSFDSAIGSFKDSRYLRDLNANLQADPGNALYQTQAAAFSGGVPIQILRNYPSAALAPFATAMQSQSVGQQLLNNSLISANQLQQFSNQQLQNAQQQLGGLLP